MNSKENDRRPGLTGRINQAILSQFARTQAITAGAPELAPNPDLPQSRRLRLIRWAVNFAMSSAAAAGLAFTAAWKLRTGSNNGAPDFGQELTIIGCALAGWLGAETMRILLPREFDIGEKASFGHRWHPDPHRPTATPQPSLPRRALKQCYGMAASIIIAAVAVASLPLPYTWPAIVVMLVALLGEPLLGKRQDAEWLSASDRISGLRHCLKTARWRPTAQKSVETGPGGGKRSNRRKRAREAQARQNGTRP